MKKEKRDNKIILSVIGVAVLLVALVGATFAYFTAMINSDSSTGTVNVQTDKLANLTLDTQVSDPGQVVFPGWIGWQKVQVTASGDTNSKTKYKLDLIVESSSANANNLLKDVQYAVCSSTTEKEMPFTSATPDAITDTDSGIVKHFMAGGNVSLPTGCTDIVADNATPENGTKISNTGTINIVNSKTITVGENNADTTDYYYILYRYINKDANQNEGSGISFSIVPLITVLP